MKLNTTEKAFSFFGWIFILLIFIIVASVLSIFFLDKSSPSNGSQDVSFWLHKKSPQITGEKQTYLIFIQNKSNRDLKDIKVSLNSPKGFDLIDSNLDYEANDQTYNWRIDKAQRGVLKNIEFTGRFFGEPGEKYFTGGLNFYLQGFSSKFYKNFEEKVVLNSPIVIDWQLPQKAGLGEKIGSRIYIDNDSSKVLPELNLKLKVPDNFVVQEYKIDNSNISASLKDNLLNWTIKDFNFIGEKEIEFSGYFKNANKRQHFFNVQATLPFKEKEFVQEKQKKPILIGQGFDINLQVADSEEGPIIGKWGQVLPVNLLYYNTNDKKIKDLNLDIEILGEKYLKNTPNFSWHLNSLDQGDFIEKSNNLNIVSSLNALKSRFNHSKITLIPKVRGKFEGYSNFWETTGKPIQIKMSTDLTLRSEARFYTEEGLKIGSGALPFQTGKESKVWVFLELKNTTNNLKDVKVKTKLAKSVSWTENKEASIGKISYNKAENTVFWEISELSPFSGGAHSLVQAQFELSITPQKNDKGKIMDLTDEIKVQAKDNFTQSTIFDKNMSLDTKLEDSMVQFNGEIK